MGEYIKREKLPQKKERGFILDDDFSAGWNACLNNIKDIPAADVRPVVRGKWIWRGFNIKCPFCEFEPQFDSTEPLYNFCPNCGADMREQPREEA